MKLYVMRPVMTPVPIIWQARTGTGLKPAKRKTPQRRIRCKSFLDEQYWMASRMLSATNSMLDQVIHSMPRAKDLDQKEGRPVRFFRYRPLPSVAETNKEKGDDNE